MAQAMRELDTRRARRKVKAAGKKRLPVAAQQREVKKRLRDYRYESCRTFGHTWGKPHMGADEATPRGTRAFTQKCTSCGSSRVLVFDRRTGESHLKYHKPKDYDLKGLGDARPSLREWRRHFVNGQMRLA